LRELTAAALAAPVPVIMVATLWLRGMYALVEAAWRAARRARHVVPAGV